MKLRAVIRNERQRWGWQSRERASARGVGAKKRLRCRSRQWDSMKPWSRRCSCSTVVTRDGVLYEEEGQSINQGVGEQGGICEAEQSGTTPSLRFSTPNSYRPAHGARRTAAQPSRPWPWTLPRPHSSRRPHAGEASSLAGSDVATTQHSLARFTPPKTAPRGSIPTNPIPPTPTEIPVIRAATHAALAVSRR